MSLNIQMNCLSPKLQILKVPVDHVTLVMNDWYVHFLWLKTFLIFSPLFFLNDPYVQKVKLILFTRSVAQQNLSLNQLLYSFQPPVAP